MVFKSLGELYHNSITSFGENVCSSLYGGETLTYNGFAGRVAELTEIFLEAGLGSGDKVALLSNNMPNCGVTYFAAVTSGMVVVPILPEFSGEEVDKLINLRGRRRSWYRTSFTPRFPKKWSTG